jgi:hypothetical protein
LEWVTGYQYLDGNQDGDPIALLSPHKVSTSLKFFLGEHLSFSALGAYQSDYDYGAPSGPGFAQFELGAGAQLDIPSENLLLSLSMENLLNDRTPAFAYYNTISSETAYYPEGRLLHQPHSSMGIDRWRCTLIMTKALLIALALHLPIFGYLAYGTLSGGEGIDRPEMIEEGRWSLEVLFLQGWACFH